ncbi:PREDICTED: squalene synthase-like [Amphimedon queenslandica]|uniref:Squalene synthase n=1 Tax=Amphimedon queenslandica TaxID=400682 RepID=A0A1X7UWN4_AMPQE|nr:PREDICTED: squalene synthase-like [Amphimedon queenslandica]|eukprot:XP_003386611.1 PREDICTED: squalene synthase-like [Amphimedon queenslandica]
MDLLKSLAHPTEIYALLQYKLVGQNVVHSLDTSSLSPDMQRCYELLNQTSRSFAAVIQALDGDLRPAVCIFYLVLRALDTIEDDMTIPPDTKIVLLKAFHTYLYDPKWNFTQSQEKDKAVLEEFPKISGEFRKLRSRYQEVISEIAQKMGAGMTVFLTNKVNTMEEWDEYCHYVAGLVGIGLTQLFAASGLEDPSIEGNTRLANSMGLFLQKTNIIRDYLEDIVQDREFWPKEAWSQFANDLRDFQKPSKRRDAIRCLNFLITSTLKLLPDVLQYMSYIKNQSIFNFCAIPQMMAIATLALCYNNGKVFEDMIKIRKGQAVQLIMQSNSSNSLQKIIAYYSKEIFNKIDSTDPSGEETRSILTHILLVCNEDPLDTNRSTAVGIALSQYKAPIISTTALIVLSYIYWYTQ